MRNEGRERDRDTSRGQDRDLGGRPGHGSEYFGSEYQGSSNQDTGGMQGGSGGTQGGDERPRERDPSHDDDYVHWREQQMNKLDEDYHNWRAERRTKFDEEFEKWRSERNATGQGPGSGSPSADDKK